MEHMNIAAILTAVVVNFFLGFIWFNLIFGKAWGKEMGYDPNVPADTKVMIKGMAFMVIGNFFFAWVLASNMAAWQYVPGISEMNPLVSALNAAFFTWLGFYFPVDLSSTAWENKSWKLFGINTGYHLASLLVVATILSYWK